MTDADGRHVCTADDPWMPEKGDRAVHPSARCVRTGGGYPGGDIDVYICPHCDLRFKVEVPQ